METFNNYKSLNLIVVKTDEYLYYLEKNGINKLKTKKFKNSYQEMRQLYSVLYTDKVEMLHELNKDFSERIGWNYGRIRY